MTARQVRTEEFYRWNRDTPLTDDELNRRFIDLHLRLQFAETEKLSDADLRQQVSDTVLAQSEAVIAGLRDKLLALTQLEWLTSSSQTSITLVEGATRTLIIPEADRDLFSPGPYVILMREGAPDTYAVARAQTFDRETGNFAITLTVVVTPGGSGPWSDWEIGSLAGSTLAQLVLLQQGYAVRDASIAAATASAGSAGAAATAAGASADARDVSTAKRNEALGFRNAASGFRDETLDFRNAAEGFKDAAAASAASIDPTALNALIAARLAKAGGEMTGVVRLQGFTEKAGTCVAGVIDAAAGSVFDAAISANTTISVTGLPGAPAAGETVTVHGRLTITSTPAITWPAGIKWGGGLTPVITAGTWLLTIEIVRVGAAWVYLGTMTKFA